MMRTLIANGCFAGAAWQQADLCASAARHGLAIGVLALFMCFLTNTLIAAWWRGHP